MSLGKLPGIKGFVSGSQGKRRFKSDLSVDMISPPLGDFRHTMHVGRGGDVFGDTSFLSNYGGFREPGSPDSSYSSKSTGFFTRTFRHVGRNSGSRHQESSRDLSSPPPEVSPIIKNAISLPQLNIDLTNGCLQRMAFPSSIGSTDDSFCTYGVQSGFVTLPRGSRFERHFQGEDFCKDSPQANSGVTMTRSDSLASFTVDLGPSLMSEVFSLIDSSSSLQRSTHSQAAGEEEEGLEEEKDEDSSLTETPVQTPKMTPPTSSMCSKSVSDNLNRSPNRTEQEDRRSVRSPDASTASPRGAEPLMEAERFQRATDVLARHYGGGSFTKARMSNNTVSAAFYRNHKTPYVFSEEEEEFKV